jgi:hypothetical protein
MEPVVLKMQRDIRLLKWYAAIVSALLIGIGIFIVKKGNNNVAFKEITVQRINVVEPSGLPRIVISNKVLSPGVLAYNKSFSPPISGHDRPGMIFYNDEGTENGGLVFMGHRDANGKYEATGHLSFDQYNQNQILYLQYTDENGQRSTGLHIDDWQETPEFWKFRKQYKTALAMPNGLAKEKLLKRLMEPKPGARAFAQRVFVGKDENKTAMVTLADREGKPRLQMIVDSNGTPALNFLDQSGHIVYSLPSRQSTNK